MDKTCKSNAHLAVAILSSGSGARVRNTWVICHEDQDNSLKGELILDVATGRHLLVAEVGDCERPDAS